LIGRLAYLKIWFAIKTMNIKIKTKTTYVILFIMDKELITSLI
jgi:hypothetical protein